MTEAPALRPRRVQSMQIKHNIVPELGNFRMLWVSLPDLGIRDPNGHWSRSHGTLIAKVPGRAFGLSVVPLSPKPYFNLDPG